MSTFEEQMRAIVRAIVREELASAVAAPGAVVYSTAPGGTLPRGWTRRRFLERVRTMPGARRSGGARGRSVVWEHDAATFDSAPPNRAIASSKPAPVVDIDAWISDAGMRLTRTA